MNRVVRGGSCNGVTGLLRTTFRIRLVPEFRFRNLGFRVVVSKKRSRQ
jgi:formylglycine-generating enzyme required for sulfatase activity